jgi:pyruvate dehydrogenase E2 component (dihydrolipoamide acetyltransferase)
MITVRVPDIGDTSSVTVIEVAVAKGDIVSEGDTLIVLESDKASMEIPAESSGVIGDVHLSEGSEVNEGDPICELNLVEETSMPENIAVKDSEVSTKALESAPSSGNAQLVSVPDTGSADGVTVIEVVVAVGDSVAEGDTLIVLESDKASMEIPAPADGIITALKISEGQQVTQDDPICEMTTASKMTLDAGSASAVDVSSSDQSGSDVITAGSIEKVVVPDTGSDDGVTVIEVSVNTGDNVSSGDTLIVLESDKASMEIPSPVSGVLITLSVKEGDSVTQGDLIADIETSQVANVHASKPLPPAVSESATTSPLPESIVDDQPAIQPSKPVVHAGPAVRAFAREIGANLSQVLATGPRGRITKDDLNNFVKTKLNETESRLGVIEGSGIPTIPLADFEAFGPVERTPLTKIQKLTADNMTRCLLNVPAVTQFDQADITELEAFRKSMKAEAEKRGIKLTPLPFLIKASAHALAELPQVNASIDPSKEEIIRKTYIHIGIAVDTPDGLVVPVIHDVNKKGVWEIAAEVLALADKAKNKKLKPAEMQGATFTISSLGSIGGTAFTPIVPSPQAAILGVSKASMEPMWDGTSFQPRLMLPICLSYDHRVINGGDGARFTTALGKLLGDIRRLLL